MRASTPTASAGRDAGPNRIVHLVDDDAAVRHSASLMLRGLSYRVKTYASGPALLQAGVRLAPGPILIDVRMPEMDGIEVQAALSASGIPFPVIIMTGHGDINLAVQAMNAGAVDFIEKPFERATLLGALERAFVRMAD